MEINYVCFHFNRIMRRYYTILATFFAFLLLASGIVFNACTKDPCKDIICRNNGNCRDGACKCTPGFEGPFCQVRAYEKFIGTWDGTLRCNGLLPEVVNMVIAPEPEANRISFYDIFDQNHVIKATVNLTDISIEEQIIDNRKYFGNGFLDGKYITVYFQYQEEGSSVVHTCVYNGTQFVNP